MTTESDPIIGNWYYHLDKGQRFQVVAMDEETQTVEVQYFDGNVDEHELEIWQRMTKGGEITGNECSAESVVENAARPPLWSCRLIEYEQSGSSL